MAETLLEQLEGFVREQRSQASTSEDKQRLARLEEKLDALSERLAPQRSRQELVEELASDPEFMAAFEAELAAADDQLEQADDDDVDDDDEAEDEPDDDDDEDEPATTPRFRREPLMVPRIYGGETEPEHVEYLDEQGRTQVRAGRTRGLPVSEDWIMLDEDTDDDDTTGDETGDDQ